MDDILAELQQTFFAEGDQILEDLESSLIELEQKEFDEQLVNKIFRLMHNFKGSSRSVGFQSLAEIAHKCEDLLTKIKSKDVPLTAKITSLLLQSTDALRKGLNALKSDRNATFHQPELVKELVAALTSSKTAAEPAPEVAAPVADQGFGFFDDEPAPKPVAKPAPKVATQPNATPAKPQPDAKSEDEQIRVSAKKLDNLVNLVGELVVNQSILHQLNTHGDSSSTRAAQTINYISKIVSDVQSVSMSLRLVPLKPVFQKMRRAIRDVATELNKDIAFIEDGEHVELDKNVVDKIIDPLTHMVRNSADHGVETKEERAISGKPATAKVSLTATSSDDKVIITLADDGKGLNKARILRKAVENGLIKEHEQAGLADQDIFNLIFKPGFSTKEVVTEFSGRGVGMEVVQKSVEDLKGTIQIESTEGKGTKFIISLPLSLSIIGGMIVRVDQREYVIPVSQLIETIELSKLKIETSATKGPMATLRGEVLPIYHISSTLHPKLRRKTDTTASTGKRPALVTSYRGKKVSFEVDEVIGQQQVVLKKLGHEFHGLPGLLGGAILSSGDPGLILSLHDLIKEGVIHAA